MSKFDRNCSIRETLFEHLTHHKGRLSAIASRKLRESFRLIDRIQSDRTNFDIRGYWGKAMKSTVCGSEIDGFYFTLTEVIFKYVVVMKPTKLGMWFKLGFWDVYSEVLSDTSWLESMCTTSRNIRATNFHWGEISGCFKRHDLDLEMTLLWVKVNLMGTNQVHTSLVIWTKTSPKYNPNSKISLIMLL